MTFEARIIDFVGDTMTDTAGISQWLLDGVRELINIIPADMMIKCTAQTARSATEGTTFDLDGSGKVLYVTRKNADSGYYVPCRIIPPMYGDLANDSSSLLYDGTSAFDPVYWVESNSSNAGTLFIKPTPTDAQPAKVYHVKYPTTSTFQNGVSTAREATTIDNFPDEAEYAVVLYASIKAAESLLATEEDTELYNPIISNLKSDYKNAINLLTAGTSSGTVESEGGEE